MAERVGIVLEKLDSSRVLVKLFERSGCSDCALASLCSLGKAEEETVEALGTNLAPGDKVKVTEGEGKLILFAFLLFIVPLMFFVLGYVIFKNFINGELFPVLLGFGLMIIYFLILGLFEKRVKNKFLIPRAYKIH